MHSRLLRTLLLQYCSIAVCRAAGLVLAKAVDRLGLEQLVAAWADLGDEKAAFTRKAAALRALAAVTRASLTSKPGGWHGAWGTGLGRGAGHGLWDWGWDMGHGAWGTGRGARGPRETQ